MALRWLSLISCMHAISTGSDWFWGPRWDFSCHLHLYHAVTPEVIFCNVPAELRVWGNIIFHLLLNTEIWHFSAFTCSLFITCHRSTFIIYQLLLLVQQWADQASGLLWFSFLFAFLSLLFECVMPCTAPCSNTDYHKFPPRDKYSLFLFFTSLLDYNSLLWRDSKLPVPSLEGTRERLLFRHVDMMALTCFRVTAQYHLEEKINYPVYYFIT